MYQKNIFKTKSRITPGRPRKPVIAAFIKFIPRLRPKKPPKKLTMNKVTKPRPAFINNFKISLMGAVRILRSSQHSRIKAPKISKLEIVVIFCPFYSKQ